MLELTAQSTDKDAIFVWDSTDRDTLLSIAASDANAEITGLNPGEATVTVTSGKASASVTFAIEALTITTKLDTTLAVGSTGTVTGTITNTFDGADNKITWSASPEGIIDFTDTETTSGEAAAFNIIAADEVTVTATSVQDAQATATLSFTPIDPSIVDAMNIYIGDWGDKDPSWAKGTRWNPFESFADTNDSNETAFDVVVEAGTVHLSDGHHEHNSRLTFPRGVTLQGQSENGTVIDQSGITSDYGFYIPEGGVTIRSLSIEAGGGYGVKVGTGAALDGFTMEDVSVSGSGKTGIDLNGVRNVTLTSVTVDGAVAGVGISMTAADGVTLNGVHTDGNAWGGVGIYISQKDKPVKNVTITSNSTFDEDVPVYTETQDQPEDGTAKFSEFNFADFGYVVHNPGVMKNNNHGENFDYYFRDLDDAADYARFLETVKNNSLDDRSTIQATDSADASKRGSDWYVEEDLSIQAAVDRASENHTINVGSATYPLTSHVNVNKRGLTLRGVQDQANPSITGAGFHIRAPGVSVENFLITGIGAIEGQHAGIYLTNDVSGVIINGNTITGNEQTGERGILFAMHASTPDGRITITNNEISDLHSGIYTDAGAEFLISSNTFTNNIAGIGNGHAKGTITSNDFHNNSSESEGIGLGHENDYALTIEGNVFHDKGGVFVAKYGDSAADLESILQENSFPIGTGIYNTEIRVLPQ